MIIVKISGGLGNQLFQYGFGQYLANELKTSVLYDIQTNLSIKDFTPRTLGLLNFKLELNIASKNDIRKIKFFTKGIFDRIERKLVKTIPFINKKYIIESTTTKTKSVFEIKDNCYYDGYWQQFKYLELNESLLKKQIHLNNSFEIENSAIINEIRNSHSVSIHIRRGDYVSIKKNTKIFQKCSKQYYENAIQYFEKRNYKPVFYIFSDDIVWAKNNFKGDKFKFITGNQPAEDMFLMSLCNHNITANSTFSWWGGWLNSNLDKTVITPKSWYVGELNTIIDVLIPKQWIQI